MATVLDELLIKLGFDPDTSGADQYESALGKIIGTAGKVGLAVGGLAVVAGGFLGKSLIDTASQFEQFKTQLTTIEGSSDKAQQSLDWISEFAKKTPYELAEVTDAFVKMKSYGLDPIKGDFMTSIGNMASGMGKSIDQAVEAVADAVTGENERLKEFGIKSSKDSKTNTVTYTYSSNGKTFTKTVKQDAKEIQGALKEIMDERFTGGMDAMSKTWEGTISNLKDTWQGFLMQIASAGVFDMAKDALTVIAKWVQDNGDKIAATAKVIGQAFVLIFTTIGDTYSFIAEKIQWVRDNSEQIISTLQMIGVAAGIIAIALAIMYAPAILAQLSYLAGMAAVAAWFVILRIASIVTALQMAAAWVIAFAPFLLIAAVIAVVIGLLWLVYQNWAQIAAGIAGEWSKVVAIFNSGVAAISAWWSGLMASLTGAIANFIIYVSTTFPTLTAIFWTVASAISAVWTGLWGAIKSIATSAIAAIKSIIASVVGVFSSVAATIRGVWTGLWGGIKAAAASAIDFVISKVQALTGMISGALGMITKIGNFKAPSFSMPSFGGKGGNSSNLTQNIKVNSISEAIAISKAGAQGHRSRSTGVRQ